MKRLFLFVALGASACAEIETLLHPGEEFDQETTVVWSPLFQAGWDEMERELGGEVVAVEPANLLVEQLSHFGWNRESVLPQEGWKIWTGPATEETLRQANQEAARLTGEEQGPFAFDAFDPEHRLYLGLLDRAVEFRRRFYRARKVSMPFTTSTGEVEQVQFFGVKGRKSANYGKSVRVLGYRPSEWCFALQILVRDSDETVVLFRPGRELSFARACQWIRAWGQEFGARNSTEGGIDDHYLHARDLVQVPYLALSTDADLTARLQGIQWTQKRALPRRITYARQKTGFRLHERGAVVRVEAEVEADPFAKDSGEPPVVPRQFVFDGPFFVFLWRDGADWPYFGCWVGSAERMRPFE